VLHLRLSRQPLGGYDQQLWAAKKLIAPASDRVSAGVNEDLAATACWDGARSRRISKGDNKYDGVFAIGTARGRVWTHWPTPSARQSGWIGIVGGVLCLMGDDHTCESSTTAHQSEFADGGRYDADPQSAGVQEVLDTACTAGAVALSRMLGGAEVHERHHRRPAPRSTSARRA